MKLYIKQKVFSWGDKFSVKNEYGEDVYFVKGEVFTIGKKLHICDTNDNEIAFIKQKVLTFLPRYYIFQNEQQIAEVVKKISLLTQKYVVNGLDLEISGDFLAHDYSVMNRNGDEVMSVTKKWLTWGDTYEIDTHDAIDPVVAVSLLIVIDACMASEAQAANAHMNMNN